jgi:UPF0716 protein FxsA
MPYQSKSKTMPWLFILFVLVPALELYLLIQIGTVIGAWNTFLLILATGLLGSWLAKSQGLATWQAMNQRFGQGQIPGKELMDGASILVCAALLLTPGILTDAIGLAGLIPFTRTLFRNTLTTLFAANPAFRVSFGAGNVYNSYRRPSSETAASDASQAQVEPEPIVSGAAKSRPTHDSPVQDA